MNYNFKVMKIDEDYHIKMRIMKDLLEKNFKIPYSFYDDEESTTLYFICYYHVFTDILAKFSSRFKMIEYILNGE